MRIPALLLVVSLPLTIFGGSAIEIQSEDLPRAIPGFDYSAAIQTSVDGLCPTGNVGLSVVSGSLPRGLRTTDEGIAGVPKEMGVFRFQLRAGNTCASVIRQFELLVTARPILRAVPEKIEFSVSADGAPQSDTILISSTWTGLPYTVSTPNGGWLKLRQSVGSTPEYGSALSGDRVTVTVVPRELPPGVYRASITVAAWQADAITIEVLVKVLEPARPATSFLK
jgi:hypothetical protein